MPADPEARSEPIVPVALGATAVFTIVQLIAAVAPDGAAGLVAVVWSLALFAVGSFAFVGAFVVAAGRSRDERVTIAGIIWLTNAAPAPVARALRAALIIQCVVALGTAAVRPFSAVAFGILAPMFGLGCLGWFGARHGSFASIASSSARTPAATPVVDAGRPKSIQAADQAADAPEESDLSDPDDFDQLFRRRRRRR